MFDYLNIGLKILKVGVGLSTLFYAASSITIGRIISHPYKSTIYVEPSNVVTKLENKNSSGLSAGKWYLAYYVNKSAGNNDITSTIYMIGTHGTKYRLQTECYYNKSGAY